MNLPTAELATWLRGQSHVDEADIAIRPLTGGQSNPTWLIEAGERRFVLRKKPSGQLLASAHAIDREYRVMKALQGSEVPVPQMLAWCDDASVVGTPFYLMEYLDGRVFMDQGLPCLHPVERDAIYREMNRVIAALHAINHETIELGTFGKAGNYFGRQIARWSRQVTECTLPLPASMRSLMDWLPEHIPENDEARLVHGDYRMDNLVFHKTEPRIIGVLDWELSTLGHPLADFSYQCMAWHIPATLWRGIGGLDLAALGIPSEDEYVGIYARSTGRDPSAHWQFYLAYNFFRIAAILHGIAQRAADGNASSPDAMETGRKAGPLADIGWQCALRYKATGES
jgi:aminoglycoside phosphotransferase (APT) family kinase protein